MQPGTTTDFGRDFRVKCLTDAVLKENLWLRDLLSRWHPPGNAIGKPVQQENEEHLRLAIRNGYLNFYRGGQSVAKVGFSGDRLYAKIHKKFVYGEECGEQGYVTLTTDGFLEHGTERPVPYDVAHLRKWISRADSRSKREKEKRFVDRIVGYNRNIIDLEMGLSAPVSEKPVVLRERVAFRMDLVGLEPISDWWRIVFWEAKLVTNKSARCRGSDDPEVINQLNRYINWLDCRNKKLVAEAYRSTCLLLVELHGVARQLQPDIAELGPGIRAVAARDVLPLIDVRPRLLIDNRSKNTSFEKNDHLAKLKKGLHVQVVENEEQMTLDVRRT